MGFGGSNFLDVAFVQRSLLLGTMPLLSPFFLRGPLKEKSKMPSISEKVSDPQISQSPMRVAPTPGSLFSLRLTKS